LDATGYELSIFPNYENLTYTARKSAYALHLIPYFVVVWSFFYNRKRSDRLIEDYEEEYGEEEKGKVPKILLIMVAPAVVLFSLSVMRHKGFL
jgi:uncharacterized membrane protein